MYYVQNVENVSDFEALLSLHYIVRCTCRSHSVCTRDKITNARLLWQYSNAHLCDMIDEHIKQNQMITQLSVMRFSLAFSSWSTMFFLNS